MKCERCDEEGTLVRDPYLWEIYDEEKMVVLCDDHFQERKDDI